MRTRQCHITHVSTRQSVLEAKSGSWANTALSLGFEAYEGATLSAVARGKPSAVTLEGENKIRRALGLPVIATYTVAACPSCGSDHGLRGIPDCHGAEVAAVVTLAPGQRVAAKRQPAAVRCLSDYPVAVLAQMIAGREVYKGRDT